MLNKIIAFSLRNRALVLLATLILIIGGCWTAKTWRSTSSPTSTPRPW